MLPTSDQPVAPSTVPNAGDILVSEERLHVAVETVPYARARIHIEETTEELLVPVTVTRQRARIEYLALPGDEAGEPTASVTRGPWVTLFEETPVVTVERHPFERVRLVTSWVAGEVTVTESLGREAIAVKVDGIG